MKKSEKMFCILIIITLLCSGFIRKFEIYSPVILGIYEGYLLFAMFFIIVCFFKSKKIYDPGILIIALTVCIFCLFYNTFILLFTISLSAGNFHSV